MVDIITFGHSSQMNKLEVNIRKDDLPYALTERCCHLFSPCAASFMLWFLSPRLWCGFDVDSLEDEKHYAELSSRLRFVCGQEDDAVCEHCAWEVSFTLNPFYCTLFNPLMVTLKLQSNGPLYNYTVTGTLAIVGWAVTFGTARRGLGGLWPRLVPSLLYQM